MVIKDENKRMIITISREDYSRLERAAKENTRSVSKQALHYIKQGLNEKNSQTLEKN